MLKWFLDQDGVLTDFVRGAHEIHNIKKNVYDDPVNHGKFDMVPMFGMTDPYFWKPMGYEYWRKLEWMPDGKEILAICMKYFTVKQTWILTAPCDNDGCCDGKLHWIERHAPQFKRRVHLGRDKEVCANPTSVLIDDRDSNLEIFRENGGQAILVPRLWNSEHKLAHKTLEVLEERIRKEIFYAASLGAPHVS